MGCCWCAPLPKLIPKTLAKILTLHSSATKKTSTVHLVPHSTNSTLILRRKKTHVLDQATPQEEASLLFGVDIEVELLVFQPIDHPFPAIFDRAFLAHTKNPKGVTVTSFVFFQCGGILLNQKIWGFTDSYKESHDLAKGRLCFFPNTMVG